MSVNSMAEINFISCYLSVLPMPMQEVHKCESSGGLHASLRTVKWMVTHLQAELSDEYKQIVNAHFSNDCAHYFPLTQDCWQKWIIHFNM